MQCPKKTHNVKRHDNVLIYASNTYEFICGYFAIHLAGARSIPVDPNASESTLNYISQKVRPRVALSELDDFLTNSENVSPINPESIPTDIADITFTSGSTGEPKGVAHNHHQQLKATEHIVSNVGNTKEDIELLLMPLGHSFGLGRMRSTLFQGT